MHIDPFGLLAATGLPDKLSWFYTYGWFTGSILGGLIYYLMCRIVQR